MNEEWIQTEEGYQIPNEDYAMLEAQAHNKGYETIETMIRETILKEKQ